MRSSMWLTPDSRNRSCLFPRRAFATPPCRSFLFLSPFSTYVGTLTHPKLATPPPQIAETPTAQTATAERTSSLLSQRFTPAQLALSQSQVLALGADPPSSAASASHSARAAPMSTSASGTVPQPKRHRPYLLTDSEDDEDSDGIAETFGHRTRDQHFLKERELHMRERELQLQARELRTKEKQLHQSLTNSRVEAMKFAIENKIGDTDVLAALLEHYIKRGKLPS
eukprot:m.187148 g.187148  ORF g.187148 m.187148 type:complete len:226 (+) comp14768_c0_seq7:1120-1797(+)